MTNRVSAAVAHPWLIRRLLAGDERAARVLVRRYRVRSAPEAVDRFVKPRALTPAVFGLLADAADGYRLERAAAAFDRDRRRGR